jgi:glycosyltransferase involved in cell wall biosynthesis
MNRLPLSVCMISGAEAGRIGRALESVADWAGEIIVVLNAEVSDGTEAIAHKYGARVFREPWKGYVAQKASAAQKAAQEWLLGLDADEVVSPELREEIHRLFAEKKELEQFAAFSFPRLTMFCGRWIRHGDWYPDRSTRLWRKPQAAWGGIDPHARLEVRGKVRPLRSPLLHYNAENIDRQVAKITGFSSDFVRHMQATGRKTAWLDLAIRPVWRFARSYFFRLGFLDGWPGYYIAWMTAFHTVTRYAKLREAEAGANSEFRNPNSEGNPKAEGPTEGSGVKEEG